MNEIFRKEGYYLDWEDDDIFDASERLCKVGENRIHAIIFECCKLELFDKELMKKEKILTSKLIQEEFINMCTRAKRTNKSIKLEYSLLETLDQSATSEASHVSSKKNKVSSEETHIYPEETALNPEESRHSRVEYSIIDYSKEKNIYIHTDFFKIKKEELMALFIFNKNYPIFELDRFLNYYNGTAWKIKGRPIEDPMAIAMNWSKLKSSKPFVPEWLHAKWKSIFITYEQALGIEKANCMLYLTPSFTENILDIKGHQKYWKLFEEDIPTIRSTIKELFGDKVQVRYP